MLGSGRRRSSGHRCVLCNVTDPATATSLTPATSLALPLQRPWPLQQALVPGQCHKSCPRTIPCLFNVTNPAPERSWYLFNVTNTAPERSWYLFNVTNTAPERSWYLFNVTNPAPKRSWYLFHVPNPTPERSWYLLNVRNRPWNGQDHCR